LAVRPLSGMIMAGNHHRLEQIVVVMVFLEFVYLLYRGIVGAILLPYDFNIRRHCDPLDGQLITPS
jgi:hypothetical protein